jgi:hypothetical protein
MARSMAAAPSACCVDRRASTSSRRRCRRALGLGALAHHGLDAALDVGQTAGDVLGDVAAHRSGDLRQPVEGPDDVVAVGGDRVGHRSGRGGDPFDQLGHAGLQSGERVVDPRYDGVELALLRQLLLDGSREDLFDAAAGVRGPRLAHLVLPRPGTVGWREAPSAAHALCVRQPSAPRVYGDGVLRRLTSGHDRAAAVVFVTRRTR